MEVNMKDELTSTLLSDIQECFGNMSIVSNYQSLEEKKEPSDQCSAKRETSVVDYLDLNPSDSHPSPESYMCLKKPDQFLDSLELKVSNRPGSYSKKTMQELNTCTLIQLKAIVEDLTQTVERVSSELVQLLLENDALQQESDARNIAIEQLLKMTVKVNESDLKPVQMSVILPDDDCDEI